MERESSKQPIQESKPDSESDGTKETRFCEDCKFYSQHPTQEDWDRCHHPNSLTNNLVRREGKPCNRMRTSLDSLRYKAALPEQRCTEEGLWFERKSQ